MVLIHRKFFFTTQHHFNYVSQPAINYNVNKDQENKKFIM